MSQASAIYGTPGSSTPKPNFSDVLKEDGPKIALSSVAVIFVFGGVSVMSRMHPDSPLAGIIAGVPTGLLSAFLIASPTIPTFMHSYTRTTLILFVTVYLLSLLINNVEYVQSRPHQFILVFIAFWALLNYVFNFRR